MHFPSLPEDKDQVALAALVAGTDNTGNYYYPAVQAQFDEAVEPGSVNDQTVIVTDASGKPVKADVRYDAAIDQMQLLLREEPQVGKAYAVTITTARQRPGRQPYGGQLQLELHHLRRTPAGRAAQDLYARRQTLGRNT